MSLEDCKPKLTNMEAALGTLNERPWCTNLLVRSYQRFRLVLGGMAGQTQHKIEAAWGALDEGPWSGEYSLPSHGTFGVAGIGELQVQKRKIISPWACAIGSGQSSNAGNVPPSRCPMICMPPQTRLTNINSLIK